MASPAARGSELDRFGGQYPFGLDDFQLTACAALESGRGVLVAAPTGAGKTVVGEFAVHLALAAGRKCFYTTPIKALSNQKYADLVAHYGAPAVGLLTGDNSINGEAPIVVMTTEVLRNMLYAGSPTLTGLGHVVMDEVHYLADPLRGAAWEEVIIHLPESVTVVSLSATVSNAEEFGEWLHTVRGDTAVVVSEHRPVPLWQHVLAADALHDLFTDDEHRQVNPDLVRMARDARRPPSRPGARRRRARGGPPPPRAQRGSSPPRRPEVIAHLDREGLLPAITFIFSRAGCDAAVTACLRAGLRLTTAPERAQVRAVAAQHCAAIAEPDLAVLGYPQFVAGLERGVAAHHAGMLPAFKQVVEELFARGLVKAVFATETLALGINMPARTVVLERLVKFNGETHAEITAGEYTQLTGRAGRRGIDVEGHAVVLWDRRLDPAAVAGLASTRTYPLRSSFRPSYNMAVNLVARIGRPAARQLLETSFAQFQADRGVVGLAAELRRQEEALAGYGEASRCDHGDFAEYFALRTAQAERESELARSRARNTEAATAQSLERLRAGDVIEVPAGRHAGAAVVLDPGVAGSRGQPRPCVLTAARQVRRLSPAEFRGPVEALDRIRIPRTFDPRSPRSRRDLAATLRNRELPDQPRRRRPPSEAARDPELARLRRAQREHPCHRCPDREDHARWAQRRRRLETDAGALRTRIAGRTATIARTFDGVCALLDDLGYLDGDRVTDRGVRLGRLYTELDLLAAECLRQDLWSGLSPAELAACASALVYSTRMPEEAGPPRIPSGAVATALERMLRLSGELSALERTHRLRFLREPDPGFAWASYRWAGGVALEEVLADADMPPGDFVRWTKQLIDLLGQIAAAGDADTRASASAAIDGLRRGIVAYSSVA